MKCFCCGVEKDLNALEISSTSEEDGLVDEPISPLAVLECCSLDSKIWKIAVICHKCFHKLEPDMWIDEACWDAMKPAIAFDKLPEVKESDKWNPISYDKD